MEAARFAVQSGFALYRDEDQSVDSALFDTYAARIARYSLNTLYLENTQYSAFNRLRYSARFAGRYRHMRGIYNFVSRLIDLQVHKTYGGRIDWAGDLRTGAIPIVLGKRAKPIVLDGVMQILEWSNFGDNKDLYVRNGATLGDSFLKGVSVKDEADDTKWRMVYMEILDPHDVKDLEHDARGNVKFIVIEYWRLNGTGERVLFREEIDKQEFRFYEKDELINSHPNPFQFVPVVHVRHKHIGKKWGVTSFRNTLEKLDELNDGASVTKDGLRKANNPSLVVKGGRLGRPNQELLERDGMMVFELTDPDMSVEPITPVTDAAGSIANMKQELTEIDQDNPELTLQQMRDKGGELSGTAIENYYSDASDSLEAIQGTYDEYLIRMLKMCLTMAGVLGIEGFPFTLESYSKGELNLYIKERKVFSDRVSLEVRSRLIMEAANNPAWEILARDLEVSEEDILLVKIAISQAASDAMRGVMEAAFNQDGALMPDTPTADIQTPDTPMLTGGINASVQTA